MTKEEKAAYDKAYKLAHKAEIAAYNASHKAERAVRDKKYQQSHKAKIAAYLQTRRVQNAAYRKAYWRGYAQRRKAELAAYGNEWRKNHQDEIAARMKDYRLAHKDQGADNNARRRARKRGATVEKVSRDVVYQRDAGICHICGKKVQPKNWHLDHIVALARGGEHSYRNVAVSHPKCNRRKHTGPGGQLRLL